MDYSHIKASSVAGSSGFFAHGSGSAQTPSANSWTSVTVFGTERFDIANNFASNTFTAPATGKYYLSTSLTFDSVSGNFLKVRINPSGFTNPSDVSTNGTDGLDGNGHKSLGLSYIIDMTSGQTADVQVYTSSASLDILANNHSYFSGIRIA